MGAASRYFPRAPRYIYRPQDQRLMRFKGMEKSSAAIRAQTRDVSATGISFVMSPGEAPFEGEILKIEWVLPGGKQIAWYAAVVRIESRIEWDPRDGEVAQTVVALRFHQVSSVLTRALHRSLSPHIGSEESSTYDLNQQRRGDFSHELELLNKKQLAVFGSLLVGTFASFVLMTLPFTVWLKPFQSLFN